MAANVEFCPICLDEYFQSMNNEINCVGPDCLIPTYFDDPNDFHVMLLHYGYSLLQKVIQHRHIVDSTGLELWITTKLVDIKAMKNIEKLIKDQGPDQGPDPEPDQNQRPVRGRVRGRGLGLGRGRGEPRGSGGNRSSASDDSHGNDELGGGHGDMGSLSTALVPYRPLTQSSPQVPPRPDVLPSQAVGMNEGKGIGGGGLGAFEDCHDDDDLGGSSSQVPSASATQLPPPPLVDTENLNQHQHSYNTRYKGSFNLPVSPESPPRKQKQKRKQDRPDVLPSLGAFVPWVIQAASATQVPPRPDVLPSRAVGMNEGEGIGGGGLGDFNDCYEDDDLGGSSSQVPWVRQAASATQLPPPPLVDTENLNQHQHSYNTKYKGSFNLPVSPESPPRKQKQKLKRDRPDVLPSLGAFIPWVIQAASATHVPPRPDVLPSWAVGMNEGEGIGGGGLGDFNDCYEDDDLGGSSSEVPWVRQAASATQLPPPPLVDTENLGGSSSQVPWVMQAASATQLPPPPLVDTENLGGSSSQVPWVIAASATQVPPPPLVDTENLNQHQHSYNTRYKGSFHTPVSPESPPKKKKRKRDICSKPYCDCRRTKCPCYLARLARGE